MMSYIQLNLKHLVTSQYRFKMKAFIEMLNPLLFMQVIAILFSLGGVGSRGMGNVTGYITVTYMSTEFVLIFTIIWAFIISIQLTMKSYRRQMQAFVYDSRSIVLSDGLFLLTGSAIGAVFTLGSHYILQAIQRFILKKDYVLGLDISPSALDVLFGLIATILIIFTISMIGYFLGTIAQRSVLLAYLVPSLLIGMLLVLLMTGNDQLLEIFQSVFSFYFFESNFLLFALKFIGTSLVFFLLSIKLSKDLEVAP